MLYVSLHIEDFIFIAQAQKRHPDSLYDGYIARKVGTVVVGLLQRQFFDAYALQHGNAHAVVAGVK